MEFHIIKEPAIRILLSSFWISLGLANHLEYLSSHFGKMILNIPKSWGSTGNSASKPRKKRKIVIKK